MPKKLTDKDRILAFAFKADAAELSDAIGVLKAALAAKTSKPRAPRTASKPKPVATKAEASE